MDPRHLGDGRRTLQVVGAASDTLVLCQGDLVNDQWFSAPPARVLTGDEPFIGCAATVYDFWRFAMSDLLMNNVRGYLAEFLVARAVQAVGQRIEWDAFDVLTPDGVKVEVKSSAYLQVWDQRAPSRILFSGLRGRPGVRSKVRLRRRLTTPTCTYSPSTPPCGMTSTTRSMCASGISTSSLAKQSNDSGISRSACPPSGPSPEKPHHTAS